MISEISLGSTFNTSWDRRLCSGFGTTFGNIMLKNLEIKLGFWDNIRKYNVKKYRDKAWDLGQCTEI